MARETLRAISAQPKIPKLIGVAAMVGGGEMWGGGEARVSDGELIFYSRDEESRSCSKKRL